MLAILLRDPWDSELNDYLEEEYRLGEEEEERQERVETFAKTYCRCKKCGYLNEYYVWMDENENAYCEDCFPDDEDIKEYTIEDLMEEWS